MAEQNKIKHVIPKKALYHAAFNWETWVQCCYNYERMMGMACGHTFVPVINYLYKDDLMGQPNVKKLWNAKWNSLMFILNLVLVF